MTMFYKVSRSQRPKSGIGCTVTHKVNAVKSKEMLIEKQGLHVSNSEFLNAIFSNTPTNLCSWTTFFAENVDSENRNKWTGQGTHPNKCLDSPNVNAYFSVAQFEINKKPLSRSTENFVRMGCLVLDDAKDSQLMPSWKLETSPNNYQLGFILRNPITDQGLAKRLLEAIRDASFVNQSDKSGNNIVRYARLPIGYNNKSKYGSPFLHVMHQWEPTLRYSLEELIVGLSLDRDCVLHGIRSKTTNDPFGTYGIGVDVAEMTRQILNSEHYHEPCLKLTSHLISVGMNPIAVKSTVEGIMQAIENKPGDWKQYYDQISSMVDGAFKKFSPDPLTDPKTGKQIDVLEEFKPYEYNTTKLTAPRYVIDGFLSAEIFTIAGEAGVGKSSILVPLAAIAAHICSFNNTLKPKLRRNVVYMTEDPDQVERILFAIKKHWDIQLSNGEIRERFTVIPVHRSKKEVLGALITRYSEIKGVTQVGKKGPVEVPALFVFDTAAATFSLESENDNAEVSAAISICKKACLITRTPLWIVSHIPKAVTGDQVKNLSARGAGAWTGDVNGTAFIGKNNDDANTRYLWLGKKRFVPEYDTLAFDAHFGSELVEDELGDMIEIPYMYSSARKSSTKERVDQASTAKDGALRKSIYFAVLDATNKNIPINRTGVKEIVKGSSTLLTQTIAAMIIEGVLIEYERTDKCNNNQKMALKVAVEIGAKP
jgi:hypothetical protein